MSATVALAHDYVTQRGGAERVVLSLARAFPDSTLHTTLYEPEMAFPEFTGLDLRTSPLNRWSLLRRHHRLAMPLLAPTVSRMTIDADVVIASSSGWAHGMRTTGRKIVYCHAPARWLYQPARYAGSHQLRSRIVRTATAVTGPALRAWDRRAAESADRYLVNSTAVGEAVAELYGIDATVVNPPVVLLPQGPEDAVDGVLRPFVLCVARLLPYKNVDAVIDAVAELDDVDLVVVGAGPEREALLQRARRSGRTHLAGTVSDAQLRWLYANCVGLVAASYEDYGLSPLEAAAFGKPVAALRAGGYLDTVAEGRSGVFFTQPRTADIAVALDELRRTPWDTAAIVAHAEGFSERRFIERMRALVA
jgi:glycosyltransferase involved in cell wall biosynthesis